MSVKKNRRFSKQSKTWTAGSGKKERLEQMAQERTKLEELRKQREIVTRQRKSQYREKLNMHRELIQRQRERVLQEEKEVMLRAPKIISQVKRKRRKIVPEIYIPPPKPDFIQCLGLMEKPENSEPTPKKQEKEIDSDCEIIDVSLPEGVVAPMTPRTPKSLMSQLSRDPDSHVRRRHLSFSGEVSGSESEDDDSDDEDEYRRKPSAMLFGIDLSSVLGQRVKKHPKSAMTFQSSGM